MQWIVTSLKCCLPEKLIWDSLPGFSLLGAGHVDTLCRACTQIINSQEESKCFSIKHAGCNKHCGGSEPHLIDYLWNGGNLPEVRDPRYQPGKAGLSEDSSLRPAKVTLSCTHGNLWSHCEVPFRALERAGVSGRLEADALLASMVNISLLPAILRPFST